MNEKWKYQDIIDLEYFFQADHDAQGSALHGRDRQIYLRHMEQEPGEVRKNPRKLLKIWLAARRRMHGDESSLPGTLAGEAHGLLRLALVMLGILSGGSAGLAFFSYSGTTPVNTLHFLVLFVFSQALLAILLLARAGLLQLGLRTLPQSLTFRISAWLAERIISAIQRRGSNHLNAEQRLAVQAAYGRLKAAGSTYSPLLYWPLFQLIQLAAVCFNLGLLTATFLKIMVSDVAFGWQSTMQFSSQSLYIFVKWLALPWSWFIPEGTAHPTLQEIEGSRIILKEGIANLQTPDLVSWWPFLLLCLLFYGLLLRLSLYGLGRFQQHKAASRLEVSTPAARQVLRRMQTPVVSTQAQPEASVAAESPGDTGQAAAEQPVQSIPLNPVCVLVPDEIYDQCSVEELAAILARESLRINEYRRFMVDYQSDQQLLDELAREDWSDSAGIVILMEAWMPPLVGFLTYVRELRLNVGTGLPIMLRLVGRPSGSTPLTPVTDETLRRVWRQKIAGLGDPHLETGDLLEEESA